MGKRSNFERVERDYYPTPREALLPLLPHLAPGTRFIEPCAGDGRLVMYLEDEGMHCACAADIEPRSSHVGYVDATVSTIDASNDEYFITNPPWNRKILHPIIENLSRQAPAWLLFDADWMHTKQAAPYMERLRKVVSVGRVKWFPDSKMTGKDNCAWHLFDRPSPCPTLFYGRT